MSFIYDDNLLINSLLRAAGKDLLKNAQTQDVALRMATPLITRLQRQINPGAFPKTSSVGVEKGTENLTPQATTADLRTLGDFLQWAANNKITWEGKRIAYGAQEQHPEDAWTFSVYKQDRSARDLVSRQADKITAFAAKPELISYLSYLRDGVAKTNKVLQVMLSKIIGQVNEFLTSAGEKPIDKRSTPEAKSEFDPNAVVDAFTTNELDPENPTEGAEGFPLFVDLTKKLTMKDLANEASFKAWLSTMRLKEQNFSLLNPKANPCPAIHVLFQRARYLSNVGAAKDNIKPGYSKMAAAYLRAIQEFGSRIAGPDGKACAVVNPGTSGGIPGGSVPGSGAGRGAEITQKMSQIVSALPFDTEDVDFVRIKRFFNLYLQSFASSDYRGQAESAIADANQAMETASRYSSTGNQQNFRLTRNAQEFFAQVKSPYGNNTLPLLFALQQVIVETGRVLGMFFNEYARAPSSVDRVSLNDEQKHLVEAQYSGAGSLYNQNLREVQSLIANVKSLASNIKWTV